MRELPKRILAAILIIGPIVLLSLWHGGYVLLVFVMAISLGLLIEFRKTSRGILHDYQYIIVLLLCWIWHITIISLYPRPLSILLGAALIIFLAETALEDTSRSLQRTSTALFLFIYCGVLTSTIILVRRHGAFWAIMPAAMVWTADTFAYWGGSLTGKHKLARTISPNKTIEGFLWGIVGAFIVAWISSTIRPDRNALAIWLCALSAGLAGQLGDLFESKIKRQFGIKDMGTLFPGHGGVWDRTDSLLWVYPLVWMVLLANLY